eukprot:CAMPEP_0184864762 /NCGR_PEP_ID=MMETSP0580-20130426/16019_1 /TAXON_ID=1118495 /ORGANISM="Dactyliosolen fragilissimus" /LENGTH=271 /DNA_ID=CAMNT_0027363679 /DNA_START=1 /DNA_END=813 /DNA_ORIENTATION=+
MKPKTMMMMLMMIMMQRYKFIMESIVRIGSMSTSTCIVPTVHSKESFIKTDYNNYLTLEDSISLIQRETAEEYLLAVKNTGKFLYRGEDDNVEDPLFSSNLFQFQKKFPARICSPAPDLLLPNTYNDEHALSFFQNLESRIMENINNNKNNTTNSNIIAKPSNGHIATPSKSDAALWGPIVSVWPLGNKFGYLYPKHGKLFYDSNNQKQQEQQQLLLPRKQRDLDEDFVLNEHLEVALENNQEVLFATSEQTTTTIADTFSDHLKVTSSFL